MKASTTTSVFMFNSANKKALKLIQDFEVIGLCETTCEGAQNPWGQIVYDGWYQTNYSCYFVIMLSER